MSSSNLYKRGFTLLNEDDARIIDSEALAAIKIGSYTTEDHVYANPPDKDGFSAGLTAEVLNVLTEEETETEAVQAKEAASESAFDAQALFAQTEAEIAAMRKEAESALQTEREQALKQAKEQGYREGFAKGQAEADAQKAELEQEKQRLEAQYAELVENLEPQFIETLTGIYEQIFHVELSDYHDIIVYLIADALGQIDGGRNILIHVSRQDYANVNEHKSEFVTGGACVEIVEDVTLSENQALIETDGGIFDCSVGTQLEELGKRLRLLSYHGTSGE